MESEELQVRELIESFFEDEVAPSQAAEYVAYFVRRVCRGVIEVSDVTDSSYNSLFWEKEKRSVIRQAADERVKLILGQDFRKLPDALRKVLMYTICTFVSHNHENYFVCSYLKGMILDTYEKLEPKGNNEIYFRVKGVLWDIIEDAYTGMINYGSAVIPETPDIAPEN